MCPSEQVLFRVSELVDPHGLVEVSKLKVSTVPQWRNTSLALEKIRGRLRYQDLVRFHYLGEPVEPEEGCATDRLSRVARPAARVERDLQRHIAVRRPREVAEDIANSGRRLDRVSRIAEDGP